MRRRARRAGPLSRSNSSATAWRIAVDRRLDRRLGEQRAAEIGVQHGAGQVEDRPHARPRLAVELRERRGGDAIGVEPPAEVAGALRAHRAADLIERRAHRVDDRRAAEPIDGGRRAAGVFRTSSTEGRRRSRPSWVVPWPSVADEERIDRAAPVPASRAPAGRAPSVATSSATGSSAGVRVLVQSIFT